MADGTTVVEYLTTNTDLKKVADAIRTKGGTTEKLSFPDGFALAIQALTAGSIEEYDGHYRIIPKFTEKEKKKKNKEDLNKKGKEAIMLFIHQNT